MGATQRRQNSSIVRQNGGHSTSPSSSHDVLPSTRKVESNGVSTGFNRRHNTTSSLWFRIAKHVTIRDLILFAGWASILLAAFVTGNFKRKARAAKAAAEASSLSSIKRPHTANESNSKFHLHTTHAPSCQEPLTADQVEFTLVTQLSDNRLWMMEHHCRRWGPHAPISLAILTTRTFDDVWTELTETLGCDNSQLLLEVLDARAFHEEDYPVNVLRNMALARVRTSHVMYVDVDFWESVHLHQILSLEEVRSSLASDPKLAVVVPAFQLNRQCREWKECPDDNIPMMPDDDFDLIQRIKKRKATSFDPTNSGGHGSTLYEQWFRQQPGELGDLPCIRSNRYEPYLAYRYCHDLPPYQELFTGYGKNKMTHTMLLRRLGYQFSQLGGAFVIHYPHLDSTSRMVWNDTPSEANIRTGKDGKKYKLAPADIHSVNWKKYKRGQVDALFVEFRNWMKKNVPDQARVLRCQELGKQGEDDDWRLWIDRGDDAETEKTGGGVRGKQI